MTYVKRLVLLVLSVCVLAVTASPAAAAPAPGFGQFAGCPKDLVDICIRTETTSGSIQIGSTTTPINKTIVLSGGVNIGSGLPVLQFNSSGGLIAPQLEVPGGLSGLTGLSEALINLLTFGAHRVYAQTILAGPALVIPGESNVDVRLPVRIRLINPFLASTCSIGTTSNPVVFALTTGTTNPPLPNKPISGKVTNPLPAPENPSILRSEGNVLVDNAFAAPAATGCDLIGFGLINSLVNARVGLPAAAGTNTAILSGSKLEIAGEPNVYP